MIAGVSRTRATAARIAVVTSQVHARPNLKLLTVSVVQAQVPSDEAVTSVVTGTIAAHGGPAVAAMLWPGRCHGPCSTVGGWSLPGARQ